MEKQLLPARKLTPRQADRRQRILSATLQMIAEHGYKGTSMQAIAKASQVAEKTLYNIFGSKDRLIAATARDRSASTFEAARADAPAGGIDFLLSLADHIATVTLAIPELSRVLAPILVEYPRFVGLDGIYREYVGRAYDEMAQAGLVYNGEMRDSFARSLRLSFVSSIIFWSKGEIADDELRPYLEARMYQHLLPYMTQSETDWPRLRAREILERLEMKRQLAPDY